MEKTFLLVHDVDKAMGEIGRLAKKHDDSIRNAAKLHKDHLTVDMRSMVKELEMGDFHPEISKGLRMTGIERNIENGAYKFGLDVAWDFLDDDQIRQMFETILGLSRHVSFNFGDDILHYRSLQTRFL